MNTVKIEGETLTPSQMSAGDAQAVASAVKTETIILAAQINFDPTDNVSAACTAQGGLGLTPAGRAKNALNFALAYANRTLERPNVETRELVKWACQAEGCLDTAKSLIK